ncbi:MAG: hypothetical protein JKY56_12680 [Kofleriaceae bacterium]|nr:hypothetical protein [Kofleriaceae bacterium]
MEIAENLAYENTSGELATVGQVFLVYSSWAVDVAVGDSCPPPTNLPPGD